ncbi:MAG: ubiquitin-conjugating enzyme [Acidobacteriaceae bacterium]|nr:ubiquitin-conjugating enzyme [Acidobacteriaceae bacterium]
MPSPRIRRLMLDEETLQGLLQNWPLIQITGKAGIPPEIYRFTYNLRGLYVSGSGEILERDSHVLEVNLTLGYPRRAPQCRMLTPVFHPNFDDSVVCIGDFWAASEGLDQLIIRIGRMISYQEYNTKSPLNGLAAKWAAQNSHLLPIDPRPVAPPLNGAPKAPAPEEDENTAPVQVGPGVPTTAEDQWSEKIVISPEHSGVSNPPPAAPPRLSTFSNPTVSNAAELKTEFAVLPKEDRFFRWRLVLFFTLLAILSGCLLWYGFQRQAQVPLPVPTRKLPAGATKPAGANARRSAGLDRLRERVMQLPGSSNPEALRAEDNARKSMQAGDSASAITALKQAVSLDSNFSRAWIELGWIYSATADKSSALNAFQKAVEADSTQIVPYKTLAYYYAFLGNRNDAIATWQRLQGLASDDPDLAPNLGGLFMAEKRYPEAASLFESAALANPADAYARLRLGMVRLRSHNTDQGMEAMHKALQIDPGAEMLNDVAYEMAETNTNLAEALVYSQRSIRDVEERSQKVDLQNIQKADLQLARAITAYWDTLGWIYFKMDNLARAKSYLAPAWQLRQEGLVGDHLGQVYEKQKQFPAALHMYNLALEANPRLDETPARIRNLAKVPLPEKRLNAREELNLMRTVQLPTITATNASADFDVLLVANGKIEKANFSSGSEALRSAGKELENARSGEAFPPASTARLIRRGVLSCSSYTGCNFVFYPLTVIPGTN